MRREYALYKGDKFVDVGTLKELAKRHGVSERTISFYGSPTYQKRTGGRGWIVIRLEEDEEDGL